MYNPMFDELEEHSKLYSSCSQAKRRSVLGLLTVLLDEQDINIINILTAWIHQQL